MKEPETQQLQEFKEGIANGSDTPFAVAGHCLFGLSLKQSSIA